MSIFFEKVSIKGLRKAHFVQLLFYLDDIKKDGFWFHGNEKYFNQRHEDLRKWLTEIINHIEQEGVVVPK